MKNILISNGKNDNRYNFIDDDIIIKHSQDIININNFLETTLNNKDSYTIYIPTVRFSDSALSYTGVELALWIYMFMIRHQNFQFHIVLMGSENKGAFFEHCKYANFILSPNIHYVQNSKQDIKYFLRNTNLTKYANKDCLIQHLKSVNVEAPTAFKNAHTITNEWCVYRWSKALGLNLPNETIETSLYFTYLKTILSINEVPTVNNICTSDKKVLVIDDEVDKGWKNFFDFLLPNHVKCIGDDFKKANNRNEIIEKVKLVVKEYDPDIVILDLRLHNSDHNYYKQKEKLTGIKILEEIKRINKGIQVIGFTASNKVWNLLAWQEQGIDSFIIKESPSKSIETGYTEKSIKQLMDAIEEAAHKSYLKIIYQTNHEMMETLRKLSNKRNRRMDKTMADGIISYLQLAQSSLFASKPNNDTAFMYYFLILEAFAKQMIDENGIENQDKHSYFFKFRQEDKYLMVFNENTGEKTEKKLCYIKSRDNEHNRIPYAQKFYNIIDYAGVQGIDPVKLVKIRNEFNHPNFIESKPILLNYQNVIDIMNVVSSLIKNYK